MFLIQSEPILTPNHQFWFTLIVGLIVLSAVGGAILLGHWKIQQLRIQLRPVGTFRNTFLEMSAILRHDGPEFPEPEFKELDDLLDSANAEPEVKMNAADDVRLHELLQERAKSKHPGLREHENLVAEAIPAILELARGEDQNPGTLTGVTTVGTHAPSGQSTEDSNARNNPK